MVFFRSSGSLDDVDDQGKNGQVYAVPLELFEHRDTPLTKKFLKKFAVVNTKGASLFSVNTSAVSTAGMLQRSCKLAVALAKKIRTFQFIPKNPAGVPGQGSGGSLVQLQEFQCSDQIDRIALAGPGVTQGLPQYMCCSLRSGEFVLINLDSSAISSLPLAARAAVNPVVCLQVPDPIDDSQPEFVLCYNKSVEFKHSNGRDSRQYKVSWSSRPAAIAYVYPYLLGFTANSVEVVTMINGSLVKTLQMERTKFLANKNGVFFTSASDGSIALFKMSADALAGKASVDREVGGGGAAVPSGNVFVRRMSSVTIVSASEIARRRLSNGQSPPGTPGSASPAGSSRGSTPTGTPRSSPKPPRSFSFKKRGSKKDAEPS